MLRVLTTVMVICMIISCKTNPHDESVIADPEYLHDAQKRFSDVIVYDIFSPPVASRNYAYTSIAAYEAMAQADSSYQSLAGQISDFTAVPAAPEEKYSPALATLEAFYQSALHFIFSEPQLLEHRDKALAKIKEESGISNKVYQRSLDHGAAIAAHVIEWSDSDMYKQTRTFPDYSITRNPAEWKPTPPGYGKGIEPHWREIRPLVIDSATQFIPKPPTKFSLEKNSQFYKEAMEVYTVVNDADEEEKEIASFWDCNPYALNVVGHVMHATKKITPGGHWMSIAGIACRQANADLSKTVEAYALTSIALFDAFISCWDEKYRSVLVRPETIINEHIDQDWVPLLQTPPFPEHTSGHSVISRAAALALTEVFGDDFSFSDDTEVQYGLPVRSFTSFIHASEEAAVSRLYGGIHYRPAIDYGVEQGAQVGRFVINNLDLKS